MFLLSHFPTCVSDSKLCLSTHWMAPELEDCPPVVETIPDLDHIKVTVGLLHTFHISVMSYAAMVNS